MSEKLTDLKTAAEAGDPTAQYALGFEYYANEKLADYAQCLHWVKQAADQDYMPAVFMLGFMYEQGLGLDIDYKEAFFQYQRAANAGFHQAQCNLGALLEEGLGCEQNIEEARRWYEAAERLGSNLAKANSDRLNQ